MISHLHGRITGKGEGQVVIEVGGVGFLVMMPRPLAEEAAGMEGEVTLHTHMVLREDGISLYGFLRPGELEMFRLLISATRVGPVLAINVLSQISIPDLAAAVIGEDEEILTRISGIGKKNARRLIIELKDKMKKKGALLLPGIPGSRDPIREDAAGVLVSLGFSPKESREAVDDAIAGVKTPEIQAVIKAALRSLRDGGQG